MAQNDKIGLDNLKPTPGSRASRKRLGRGHGSGRGKTSGRGHKGQKARTGASIPAWFEGGQMPLHRRVPKRGFKPLNKKEFQVVNLSAIAGVEGAEIGPEELKAAGLVSSLRKPIKVLGEGTPGRAVTVRAHAFSATAREKLEAEGGRAELID